MTDKPIFYLDGLRQLKVDLKNVSWTDFFDCIRRNPNTFFKFDVIDGKLLAYGKGANRQIYNYIINDVIKDLFIETKHYFLDINVENDFWLIDENIKIFVNFVAIVVNAECVFPLHFNPILLETISNKQLEFSELEFFMEKADPEIVSAVKKLGNTDFDLLEVPYENPEEYYRAYFLKDITRNKLIIYGKIAKYLNIYDDFHNYAAIIIDRTFSGEYDLIPSKVLSIITVHDDDYKVFWNKFIESLNSDQLKKLLLTIGNSLSLEHHYDIYSSDTMNANIHISTCSRTVVMNKNLLSNPIELEHIKTYLLGDDKIYDQIVHNPIDVDDDFNDDADSHNQWNNYVPFSQSGNLSTFSPGISESTVISAFREFLSVRNFSPILMMHSSGTGKTISRIAILERANAIENEFITACQTSPRNIFQYNPHAASCILLTDPNSVSEDNHFRASLENYRASLQYCTMMRETDSLVILNSTPDPTPTIYSKVVTKRLHNNINQSKKKIYTKKVFERQNKNISYKPKQKNGFKKSFR